jgi:hypothetical protein
MGTRVDLSGARFERLLVVGYAGRVPNGLLRSGNVATTDAWICRCDCGEETQVTTSNLRKGNTRSCGCLHRETTAAHRLRHGHAKKGRITRTYISYEAMLARCLNPKNIGFHRYGGRGIAICERWQSGDGSRSGFECFVADLGERPEGTTLDRREGDGNYEPGNCRWATPGEQSRNTSRNRWFEIDGERLTLSDVARRFGLRRLTLAKRLKRGVPLLEAILP